MRVDAFDRAVRRLRALTFLLPIAAFAPFQINCAASARFSVRVFEFLGEHETRQ